MDVEGFAYTTFWGSETPCPTELHPLADKTHKSDLFLDQIS